MNDLEFALDAISVARAEIAANVKYVRDHLPDCAIPEGMDQPIEDALGYLEDTERRHPEDFMALSDSASADSSQAAARINERFMRAFFRLHEVIERLDKDRGSVKFGLVWMLLSESAVNMLRSWIAMRDSLAQFTPADKENA